MSAEDISVVNLVGSLTLRARAALQDPALNLAEIRELMWRVAALKGRLHCDPSNEFVGFLATLQHKLAEAYAPGHATGAVNQAPKPILYAAQPDELDEFSAPPAYADQGQGRRGVLAPR